MDSKKTVFVGGLVDDVDEAAIYQQFQAFGAYTLLDVRVLYLPFGQGT